MSAIDREAGRLREGPLQLGDWLGPSPPHCGALSLFAGTVRNTHENRAVSGILYHAYVPLAERRLGEIETEAAQRFGAEVRLAHALGELRVGDISVIVVVYAGHREQSFAACRWAIDTIKQAVPIWKEERYADGDSRFLDGVPLTDISN